MTSEAIASAGPATRHVVDPAAGLVVVAIALVVTASVVAARPERLPEPA
jgi:hypothetical protein